MNSRERIFTAPERKEPDRVPLLEWSIDPRIIDAVFPGSDYFDFLDRIGLDAVMMGYRTSLSGQPTDADPACRFKDKWGVTRVHTGEAIAYPIEGVIDSEEDLRSYHPPDPDAPDALGLFPDLVKRFRGEKAIIWENRDVLSNPRYLRGTENLFVDLYANPRFARDLIEMALDYEIRLVRRAIRAGADIVMLGDDYAHNGGPMISPEQFRNFFLPGLKRMVSVIHEEGAYCIKHTDGNIMKMIDMIVDTGIDGLNPIDPIAGMDIAEVKRRYGSRICLVGNIDCGELLTNGTKEQVALAVRECIANASPGGGHILSSSNSIHSGVKPENFLAMIEAAGTVGTYPLDL